VYGHSVKIIAICEIYKVAVNVYFVSQIIQSLTVIIAQSVINKHIHLQLSESCDQVLLTKFVFNHFPLCWTFLFITRNQIVLLSDYRQNTGREIRQNNSE
jgi:hypothetical protein